MKVLAILLGFIAIAMVLTSTTGVDTLYGLVGVIAVALGVDHYRSGTFDKAVEVEATEHGV